MDFENIESCIENQEKETEKLEQEKETIENREANLQQAILQITEDIQISGILEKRQENIEKEEKQIEQKINECQKEVYDLEQELQNMLKEMQQDREIIDSLKELGEDISEAEKILEERNLILQECQKQLQILAERLGITLNELNLESAENAYNSINYRDTEKMENQDEQVETQENFQQERTQDKFIPITGNENSFNEEYNQNLNNDFVNNILSDPNLNEEQKQAILTAFDTQKKNLTEQSKEDKETFDSNIDTNITIPTKAPYTLEEQITIVLNQYEKIQKNTELFQEPIGYSIAMNETAKSLEKQAIALQEQIEIKKAHLQQVQQNLTAFIEKTDSYELHMHYKKEYDEYQLLQKQKNYIMDLQKLAEEDGELCKEYTFEGVFQKSFSESFSDFISSQGKAYPNEIKHDCGVCTMANLANQQGAYFTEKSALKVGSGNYLFTEITSDMTEKEKKSILSQNGLTNYQEQKTILDKMGYQSEICFGLKFDEIVTHISSGHSISINLYSGDLKSKSKIRKIPFAGKFLRMITNKYPDHAVTIAGIAKDKKGNAIGLFINDTGGNAGEDNPFIYISKTKYEDMLKYTAGIGSIVCTGKKGKE